MGGRPRLGTQCSLVGAADAGRPGLQGTPCQQAHPAAPPLVPLPAPAGQREGCGSSLAARKHAAPSVVPLPAPGPSWDQHVAQPRPQRQHSTAQRGGAHRWAKKMPRLRKGCAGRPVSRSIRSTSAASMFWQPNCAGQGGGRGRRVQPCCWARGLRPGDCVACEAGCAGAGTTAGRCRIHTRWAHGRRHINLARCAMPRRSRIRRRHCCRRRRRSTSLLGKS